jgi:hypothetical protein
VFWPVMAFPYAFDDVDMLNAVGLYRAGLLDGTRLLIGPHNEHVVPLVRMLFLAFSDAFQLDARFFHAFLIGVHALGAWACALLMLPITRGTLPAATTLVAYVAFGASASTAVWYPTASVFMLASVAIWASLAAYARVSRPWAASVACLCLVVLACTATSSAVPLLLSPIVLAVGSSGRPVGSRIALVATVLVVGLAVAAVAAASYRYYAGVPLPVPQLTTQRLLVGAGIVLMAPGLLIAGWVPGLPITPFGVILASMAGWVCLVSALWLSDRRAWCLLAAAWAGPLAMAMVIGVARPNQTFASLIATDRYYYPFVAPLAMHVGLLAGAMTRTREAVPAWRFAAWLGLAVTVWMSANAMSAATTIPLAILTQHADGWARQIRLAEWIAFEARTPLTVSMGQVPIAGMHKEGLTLPALIALLHPDKPVSFRYTLNPSESARLNRVLEQWRANAGLSAPGACVIDGVLTSPVAGVVDFRVMPFAEHIRGGFEWEKGYRWIGGHTEVTLRRTAGDLVIRGFTMASALAKRDLAFNGIRVTAALDGTTVGTVTFRSDGEQEFRFSRPPDSMQAAEGTLVTVSLRADPVWRPAEVFPGNGDPRTLAIGLVAVGLSHRTLAQPATYACPY